MEKGFRVLIGIGILAGVLIIGSLLFRATFLTFVENYEFPYYYDYRTGEMDSLKRTGYFLTCPLIYSVHTIDKRPAQVTINANNRVLNAKLVEFDTRGWRTFVAWHGRDDYSNETSAGGNGNLNEILKSYAYDGMGKSYDFLHIMRELKNDNSQEDSHSQSSVVNPIDTTKVQ